MFDINIAIARVECLDYYPDWSYPNLRPRYPELDFVFDKLDELQHASKEEVESWERHAGKLEDKATELAEDLEAEQDRTRDLELAVEFAHNVIGCYRSTLILLRDKVTLNAAQRREIIEEAFKNADEE